MKSLKNIILGLSCVSAVVLTGCIEERCIEMRHYRLTKLQMNS